MTRAIKTALPQNTTEVLVRWPRLTAHLICESLGYFTPEAAANSLRAHKEGDGFFCEWYTHMAQGFDEKKVLEVATRTIERAFRNRHHHRGYMADYAMARSLVERVRHGGRGPELASWF